MIYGMYNSAAGMMVNEYRQSVLANNLANAETTGFKPEIAVFAERVPAWESGERDGASARDLGAMSGGLWLGRTHTDFGETTKTRTGNPLDVALEGEGFFVVQSDGQRQYTRDGRFLVDRDGRLVAASDNAPVLGRGGGEIFSNRNGGPLRFDSDGVITQDGRRIGQLDIVEFPVPEQLAKAGTNRFVGPDDQARRSLAYVHSGYVENSGVEPLKELVSMIEASRAYQINAQMVSLQDQSIGRLLTVVSRV